MSVATSDPRPKPVQVADTMRDRIKHGRYPSGRLPTSRELTNEFGYAGQTVRDGLAILSNEGLIFSAGNRGYFIATNNEEEDSEGIPDVQSQIRALEDRVAALEECCDLHGGLRPHSDMKAARGK